MTIQTPTPMPVACLATPLTEELIAKYDSIIACLPDAMREVRDAMNECMACVKKWWELPDSTRQDVQRFNTLQAGQSKTILVQPLDKQLIDDLWEVTPYTRECEPWKELFEALPSGTVEENGVCRLVDPAANELRNAAFHLLWHVIELSLDREPVTAERLV